jgi:hypothetical protein
MVIPVDPDRKSQKFNRATPGESLTAEPGAAAWEKPPQITNERDAIGFTMHTLENNREMMGDVIGIMDAGVAIEAVVEGLSFGGFANGLWTPDVAELMKPGLAKRLWQVAREAGVEPVMEKNLPKGPKGYLDIRKALRPETIGVEGDPVSEEDVALASIESEEEPQEGESFLNMMGSA